MTDVDMKGEIPNPVLPEQRVAEIYLSSRGIKKPEDQKLTGMMDRLSELSEGETQLSIPEIYDLIVEREDLKGDISRRGKEKPANSLSLDEKKALISQGNVLNLLSTTSSDFTEEIAAKSHARIAEITRVLDEEFVKPGVYDTVKEDLTQQVKVRQQAKEVDRLTRFIEESREQILKLARDAQVTGRSLTSMEGRTVSEYRDLTDSAQQRIDTLIEVQDVRFQVRYMELKQYRKELNSGGFVETPSRKKYATELEMLWSQGKKVLVTGATGTGKTELVRHASRRMFGIKPFEITGHEKMTPYELLGRTGMSEGRDIYRPSKLIQAMVADVQGAPFLYDEMDASPNQANIALKTLLNDGPGDTISVQMDSDKKFFIGPNYSFTGTANVKSDKHQSRFEIDPAIVRILEPMIVSYIPPAEVWDIAIASLIDRHGRLPLTREEAEKTLKDLCDASAWIQQAYLGEKVVTDEARGSFLEARGGATTGKPASLKEAVLDPGRVIGMLKGWESARLDGKDLRTFLDEQIVRFINNENFPEDDRYYLIEIFALRGFLKGRNINEFKVHTSNDVNGFNQKVFESWIGGAIKHSEEKKQDEVAYLSASQVVRLDPYKRFSESLAEAGNQLLQDSPESSQKLDASLEFAKSLLGENFLGPEEIEKAFGIEISPEEIPPIPFDQSELERAKKLNQRLVLRWDRGPNGEELTMKGLYDLLKGEFSKQKKGKVLYNTDWYESEEFFTRNTLERKWVLVTNDVIPNSTNKNYVEQTEIIIDYLQGEVFQSHPIPQELSDAISDFESQKDEIAKLLSTDINEVAIRLDNLLITHLTRQTPAEVLYDLLLYIQSNGKRLIPDIMTWSSTRSSGGRFVWLGGFDERGLRVGRRWPSFSHSRVGVCLSR